MNLLRRDPDICSRRGGKMLKSERVISRPGCSDFRPYRTGFLRDIPSLIILQPGPAVLTRRIDIVMSIFNEWEGQADCE
ncbi:MAG: hypothetical protein IPF59_09585 [Ignavibacteria bacterium]|nr:hypothetical protein [Ignavibacteria bacterium]